MGSIRITACKKKRSKEDSYFKTDSCGLRPENKLVGALQTTIINRSKRFDISEDYGVKMILIRFLII